MGARHFVLIPSYNSGVRLRRTVEEALRHWPDVWVVVDGSTDGSDAGLETLRNPGLRVIRRARNGGKGAAVFDGLRAAEGRFTHVLVMDADGQHPAHEIPFFMAISQRNSRAMILGVPRFDASAPRLRVLWRRVGNLLTRLETARRDIRDSLFGFRVYPLDELLKVMRAARGMRRFDFDTEAVVRLSWAGVGVVNRVAPVRYFGAAEGGVSHFCYGRDNLLLAAMHARLLCAAWMRRRLA